MLKVVAKIKVQPGTDETVKQLAAKLVEQTRLEAGNISYAFWADVNNPDVYAFIEEWPSQEVLDEHMATEHFTSIFPEINKYTVDGTDVAIFTEA